MPLSKSLTLRGYLVHEVLSDPASRAAAKAFILDGLAAGSLKPVIAATFPFERTVDARRFLESNEQLGKIVVTVSRTARRQTVTRSCGHPASSAKDEAGKNRV
ncbi:zinc-binding dehydrogenase [Paraburkholderia xenovorans]|uniref:zinc-binding dehydrogenase n=1 Tax=Paraburkholderia xenovorans TaxID=36873 RepID=UPI0038BB9AD2